MKNIGILFILLSFLISANATNVIFSDTIWQKNSENIRPTEDLAHLSIKITDGRLRPLQNTAVFLVSQLNDQVYANETSTNGKVVFLVPNGATYTLNLLDNNAYRVIPISNSQNLTKSIGFTFLPKKKNTEHWDLTKLEDIGKFDTIVQNVRVNQAATADKAVIHIVLRDLAGNNQRGVNITLMDRENNVIYKTHTHSNGIADFFVPNGKTYIVGVGINPMFSMLDVGNLPQLEGTKRFTYEATFLTEVEKNDTIIQTLRRNQKSTSDRVYVEAHVETPKGKPLANEKFMMRSRKTEKVYYGKTDPTGIVRMLLPKGDTYFLGSEFREVGDSVEFKYDNSFARLRVKYVYIGSEEFKRRLDERERMAAVRDSLYKIRRYKDSLRLDLMGSENFLNQLAWGKDKQKVKALINKRVLTEQKNLAKDPKFYEKAGREIQAVFKRMASRWQNKVIVTDLTGSMYPYMDQILVWHAFNKAIDKGNSYVFFNDGDQKSLSQKIVGKTGGIYISLNNSMDEVLNSMQKTMKGGGGADSPENDIEALMKAQKLMKKGSQLILIADNYSDVRDLKLLMYLKVPVRVILCGLDYGSVNEHYLEIAYATKGSIHTIEKDILNLRSLVNGNSISIGGSTYKFNRGKFLKQ